MSRRDAAAMGRHDGHRGTVPSADPLMAEGDKTKEGAGAVAGGVRKAPGPAASAQHDRNN